MRATGFVLIALFLVIKESGDLELFKKVIAISLTIDLLMCGRIFGSLFSFSFFALDH